MKTASHSLKNLRPKNVLIPGDSLWELWELKSPAVKKSTVNNPEQLSKAPASIAIPVCYVQTLPLWISSSEVSLIPEMLPLEIEKRGLSKFCDYLPEQIPHLLVNREPTRTLVVPSLLSNQLPENYINPRIDYYESSHRLFNFTPQSITLWKELGKWVFAFVRESEVVFTQSLQTPTLTAASIQTISNTWLQLETESAVGTLLHLVCWSSPTAEESSLLEKFLNLRPQVQPKPTPQFPKTHFSFSPTSLRAKQKESRQKGQLILISILFLIAYGATLGSWGWKAFQRKKFLDQLESEVATVRPVYEQIRKTSFDWDALQPALNPDRYPLEILMQISSLLPKENARLTLFTMNQNKVLIRGEAKTAEVALKLTTDLKNHPPFKSFRWEVPPPKLLPNQTAQFQLEATF